LVFEVVEFEVVEFEVVKFEVVEFEVVEAGFVCHNLGKCNTCLYALH
jgi:hypothetical protein